MRFGYDGRAFAGWARQPGLRTVEGELRRGIARLHVVPSLPMARLEVASRTDRGVSARANALALTSELSGPVLLRALNGISPDIFATAVAPVPAQFRPRQAVRRIYRYFEPAAPEQIERWRTAAGRFDGPVDVRSFGRGFGSSPSVRRTVEAVVVRELEGGLSIEVRAPSFVWGMVRKIVAAMRLYVAGDLSLARLDRAVAGTERLTLPLAEPDRLVLWEVEYPFDWTVRWAGPNRSQIRRRETGVIDLWAWTQVLRAMDPEGPG